MSEDRDTISSLARMIRLNEDESSEWANGAPGLMVEIAGMSFGKPFRRIKPWDKLCPGQTLRIPNTAVFYVAKLPWYDTSLSTALMGKLARDLANTAVINGYHVVYYSGNDEQQFIDAWREEGIYTFAYAGHGSVKVDAMVGRGIQPDGVIPPYKLAAVWMLMCYGGGRAGTAFDANGNPVIVSWRDHVSDLGLFYGTDKPVFIWNDIHPQDNQGNPIEGYRTNGSP